MTKSKDDSWTVTGFINASRWRKPKAIRRMEALSDVHRSIYVKASWADGTWFYTLDGRFVDVAWVCQIVGVSNPYEEALSVDAVDPHVESEGKPSTRV